MKVDQVTEDKVEKARRLNEVAVRRGQTLAEMALAWVLKDERMTSVIVGASSVKQLEIIFMRWIIWPLLMQN